MFWEYNGIKFPIYSILIGYVSLSVRVPTEVRNNLVGLCPGGVMFSCCSEMVPSAEGVR